MEAITQTQATTGQIKQINRFGSDAIEKVLGELGLDNPGAQRVIEHGDEFAEAIRTAALASLMDLSVTDKFKDEEVASNYGYLSGYTPKPIDEQIARLRELFPELGSADIAIAEGELPKHAEGWFAIPKWQPAVASITRRASASTTAGSSSTRTGTATPAATMAPRRGSFRSPEPRGLDRLTLLSP